MEFMEHVIELGAQTSCFVDKKAAFRTNPDEKSQLSQVSALPQRKVPEREQYFDQYGQCTTLHMAIDFPIKEVVDFIFEHEVQFE